jgi:hypothetical protein
MKTLRQIFLVPLLLILVRPLQSMSGHDFWSLDIVPTRSSAQHGASIDGAGFHVVLTNRSNSDLSVWREWCSWGHDSLSFVITEPDGRSFELKKVQGAWSKNYPDSFVVKKNGHFVYFVQFGRGWQGFPQNWKNQKIKMQAIFKINPDDESKRLLVWTGKVESKIIEIDLYK